MRKSVLFATVATMIAAVASATQADILYTEDFQVTWPHSFEKPDASGGTPYGTTPVVQSWFWHLYGAPEVRWNAVGNAHAVCTSNQWGDIAPSPDGDGFRFMAMGGDSGNGFVYTSADKGHVLPTVPAADRVGTQMAVHYAGTVDRGLRFAAHVGGSWYVSDAFGTNGSDFQMIGNDAGGYSRAVSLWAEEIVNVETDNWYRWIDVDPTMGSYTRDNDTGSPSGLSVPIVGLPPGNIEEVGVVFHNLTDTDCWALDNFIISNDPEMTWDGGDFDWNSAHWNAGQTPSAASPMIINADTNDGVVTVKCDFIGDNGGTGPARSVLVGEGYDSRLVIAADATLEVTEATTVGQFGKVVVENGAKLQTDSAVIEAGGRLIAAVQGSGSGSVLSAGQLTIGDADAIQVDWFPGTDAASMFGGVYTIAEYTGTALATATTTTNLEANIGSGYIKSVDYDVDLGDGVMGVQVELHPQGLGDTNLDGKVDGDDLATFGLSWSPSAKDKTWFDGDFDLDADIDGDDLAALGLAWAPSGIDFSVGDLQVTAVPEPGAIVMLMIGAAGLFIYHIRFLYRH